MTLYSANSTMHSIYYLLLLIAYFAILIHCQRRGGRGRGGFKRGRISGGGDSSDAGDDSSDDDENILLIYIAGIFGLVVLLFCVFQCCQYFEHQWVRKNPTFVLLSNSKHVKHRSCDVNAFQSGIWSSRYYQNGNWHGPYQFSLTFDPQSIKVTGAGSDDVGTFTIDGIYSTRTHRITLMKIYQIGPDNSSENLEHSVIIQLWWSWKNRHFQGKWYLLTAGCEGEDKFELKFSEHYV